jgi:iron complex outermembrane receptor protein
MQKKSTLSVRHFEWMTLAWLLFLTKPAQAAQQEPEPASAEDIIVTANKREERLQDVPTTITALGAEALGKLGVVDVTDLGDKVASVNISRLFTSSASPKVYIRGIGQEAPTNIARDSGVGLYIDDVYMGRGIGLSQDLGDIERVEILPGPQGTLYGRNTIGGAIKFVTAKPTGEWGVSQRLDIGNFGFVNSVTTLNLPEIARISVKLGFAKSNFDGWVRNSGAAGDFGTRDALGYRVAVRWRPTNNVIVDYAYDHARNHGTPAYQQRQNVKLFPFNFPLFPDRQDHSWRPVDVPIYDRFKTNNHALTVQWDVAEFLTVKSITALRVLDFAASQDSAESFNLPVYQGSDAHTRQFSQELLFSGKTADSRIKYNLGLYHFRETGRQFGNAISNGLALAAVTPYVPPTVADLKPVTSFDVINAAEAIYGQVTWTPPILDDKFSVDIGGRYSWDDRSIDQILYQNLPPFPVQAANSAKFHSFDPSITLSFAWTDDIMTFVKRAEGYRTGGFDPFGNKVPVPFGAESLTSYEAGIKSQFFDRRLTFNVSAFSGQYDNIQLNFFNPNLIGQLIGSTQTVNGGQARIKGVDLELRANPLAGLYLGSTLSYLTFKGTQTNPFTNVTTIGLLPGAPKWKYNLSAEYRFPAFAFGQLSALVALDHHGSELPTGSTTPDLRPGYTLLDARLTLYDVEGAGGRMSFALWGKNLTDKEYQVYRNGGSVIFGTPRNYGVSLTYKY